MENSTPQTITTICVPNDANPEVVARSLFGITSLSGLFSSIHPLLIPAPCTTIAEFGNKSLLKLLLEQALVVLKYNGLKKLDKKMKECVSAIS